MKRILDVLLSASGLLVCSPVLLAFIVLIWLQDFKSPFYIAPRTGRNGHLFKMVKLRSMVVNANTSGVDSTSANDPRITSIGHLIRKYKLDEITQLYNVLRGDMSLVGPRPNVLAETNLYTDAEKKLLFVQPGITDFASIVFSDEGDILKDRNDPDLAYNQIIRPWKSRLGLLYIDHRSIVLDISLIFYTVVAIISKEKALTWITKTLKEIGADEMLIQVCRRDAELFLHSPPGSEEIVTTRT